MRQKTILGTIMTLALIVIIGESSTRTAFAKKTIEIDINSSHIVYELADHYGAFNPGTGELKSIEVIPNNKGVLIKHDKEYNLFMIEFKKLGKYNLKFKFDNGKNEMAIFKVIDLIKSGNAFNFELYKDGKGNDVLYAYSKIQRHTPNINIKLGNKTTINNVNMDGGFTYVFKKGYLEEIGFDKKDIKKINYEVVKGRYKSAWPDVEDKMVEDDIVTAIKLNDNTKGYEGYLTIGDIKNSDDKDYSTGELYTIKLNKKESGKWIKLERGIPADRLFVTNSLYKKTKKK